MMEETGESQVLPDSLEASYVAYGILVMIKLPLVVLSKQITMPAVNPEHGFSLTALDWISQV